MSWGEIMSKLWPFLLSVILIGCVQEVSQLEEQESSVEVIKHITQANESGSIIWDTDFESTQWSLNGSRGNGNWEIHDTGDVRTVSDSRAGKRAIWLGDFNNHSTRNEIAINRGASWKESWIGFSIKIIEEQPRARAYAQWRNMRASGGVGSGVVNPVTLRQGEPGQLYFATSTVEANVDKIYETGASTGTQSHYFSYKKNEWLDIVIHWKLDPEDGFLEIWANGKKIVDETGTTTYRYAHNDGEPYDGDINVTIGTYWSSKNAPQGNAYYDEYKIYEGSGGRYEYVSPRGLSPSSGQASSTTPDSNSTPNSEDVAKAPILKSVKLSGSDYVLSFEKAAGADTPDGGYDTIINGVDQSDFANHLGLTRSISGLNIEEKNCFQVEARYTQLGKVFPRSNEICVDKYIEPEAKSPIIVTINRVEQGYQLTFKEDENALVPAGGYDTIIDGVDQSDYEAHSGFSRLITGLDQYQRHCFLIEARYTQLEKVFLRSNEMCVEAKEIPKVAKAPSIKSAVLEGSNYRVVFEQAPDALDPAGGYDTVINGTDQSDNANYSGLSRLISGLDTKQKQCFVIEARYTQLSPSQFLRSSEYCVDSTTSSGGVISDSSKGSLIFYTGFESDQWNLSGNGDNTWEYESDRGEPRTTRDSRAGSRAVHMGDYNGHITRNEIHKNRLSSWDEHWIGFSLKVKEASQSNRVYAQFRNMRPEGAPDHGGINPLTLRQGPAGKMYFATSTDERNVNVIQESGASTGTESTFFDYNLDEWIDIVIHWKLDPKDGFLEIWVNGKKIVDETGTTTYRYANVSGIPYTGEIKHTIGVYWSKNNNPEGNVYFDEYKVWKGAGRYEDVSPLGQGPNAGSSSSSSSNEGTNLVAKAPILKSVRYNGSEYVLAFENAEGADSPAGGFDTIINGKDQSDNASYSGLTRSIAGLDKEQINCFQIEARYTQVEPGQFLRSNEYCVDSQVKEEVTVVSGNGGSDRFGALPERKSEKYFYEDFEKGIDTPNFKFNIESKAPDADGYLSTVSSPTINGNKAFKARIDLGESIGAYRAEIRYNGTSDVPMKQTPGSTYGTRFSFYIPEDYNLNDPVSHKIMQYHRSQTGIKRVCDMSLDPAANPSYTMEIGNGVLSARHIQYKNTCVYKNVSGDLAENKTTRRGTIGNVQKGKWHHLVMNIKWSDEGKTNGYFKIYYKIGSRPTSADLKYEYNGETHMKGEDFQYFKMGIYNPTWKRASSAGDSREAGVTKKEIIYDDLEIVKDGYIMP